MFKLKNLVFMSKHLYEDVDLITKKNVRKGNLVIGSLYFRLEYKNPKNERNICRGRIRLVHTDGPQIESRSNFLDNWILQCEDKSGGIYGNLVHDCENTIKKAYGKQIHEIYTTMNGMQGKHLSRGTLELGIGEYKIMQKNIDEIYEIISTYTDTSGECPKELIYEANTKLEQYLCRNKLLGYK